MILPHMFAYYMRNWKLLLRFARGMRGRLRAKKIRNGDFLKQVYRVDQWALQDVPWALEERGRAAAS
eukprot:8061567-Prorocentrum_lima.AAC.1